MAGQTMLAALYRSMGPVAEVLEIAEIARPDPGPGEVRVRGAVSGVNPTDFKNRSGIVTWPIDSFQVPHHGGVGTIDAVGPGVDEARLGERVWLTMAAHGNRWGTAAHCLIADGPVRGHDVLVHGGAGAVGRCGIELGRWSGARVVTTVSSEAKAEVARASGADLVVDYRREDVVAVVRAFSPGIHRVLEVSLAANARIDAELERPRRPRHVDRHAITLDEVALHPVKRGVPGGLGVGAQEPLPRARGGSQ